MKQKQLRFTVDGQEIRARPVTVVADSRNYLVAEFVFSGDWEGLEKTAVFEQASGVVYHVLVQDGTCTVPAEVIQVPWFRVSVFGGDRLTTNRVEVSVCQSGFLPGVTPPAPTPDIYDQLLRSVAAEREQAAASADAAEADRQTVAAERIETETLAEQAGAAAKSAGDAASAAAGQARTAETAAGRAQDAAAGRKAPLKKPTPTPRPRRMGASPRWCPDRQAGSRRITATRSNPRHSGGPPFWGRRLRPDSTTNCRAIPIPLPVSPPPF